MKQFLTALLIIAGAIGVTLGVFALTLIPAGERRLGPLESIRGIPFPSDQGAFQIDSDLAHADIYIDQPVFAKNLVLTIEYRPLEVGSLSVGVRANSFWLSYDKQLFYERTQVTSNESPVTSTTVTIPLTDKLQEPNQSIDLMFFAEGENPEWELVKITASVEPTMPTWVEFKDYAKAVLYRERAL